MRPPLSAALRWSALVLLALPVAWLTVRNGAFIGAAVPLDPNEGWNAAHTLRLMAGGPLYPPAGALMVNNYPPLSFYLVAAITHLTGDAIAAGRLLSLLSFLAAAALIAATLARMGCGWTARVFGTLVFAAALLFASDYVAMDDPQLAGHAAQLGGLLLLLGGQPIAAALAMTLGLFLKHNLIALPLASGLWLLWQGKGARFVLAGVVFGLLGLLLFRLAFGIGLLSVLANPRLSSWTNVETATGTFLAWAAVPLLLLAALPRSRFHGFVLLYAAIALLVGIGFSAGDGVDANIFFDAAIAIALGLGLTVQHRGWAAPIAALALLAHLALTWSDNAFAYGPSLARQSARDIAFLRARPGPAICQQLSLCLWAGKAADIDVFNIGEAIRTGAQRPAPLLRALHARQTLQLDSLDDLGPEADAVLTRDWRIDHSDDNGIFLTPRPRGRHSTIRRGL